MQACRADGNISGIVFCPKVMLIPGLIHAAEYFLEPKTVAEAMTS